MIPSRWSLRLLQAQQVPDGYHFVATTDVPCHLFLRWTYWVPRTHKDPIVRRGVTFFEQVRFCLVSYHDNEQEEAGDTLAHTFEKQDWPLDKNRYFMFWATIGGEPSPSESPLFERTFTGVGEYVKTIGVFDSADVFLGNVKLKQGTGITLTEDDPNNAIEIAAAVTPYEGFRNHWLKFDPDGIIAGSLAWSFDQVMFGPHNVGEKGALYTASMKTWGLSSPHSCQFKIARGITFAGAPYGWFCMVATDPDIHNNLYQQHIGFRAGTDDRIYCTNADGSNRTQTGTGISLEPPKWVKWVRSPDDIKFYVDGALVATHTTNLPAQTTSTFFTFEIVGHYAGPRPLYMTCPMLGVD